MVTDSVYSVAGYFIDWKEVKKVAPIEVEEFENKAEEFKVVLKMVGYHFDLKDVLEFFMLESGYDKGEIESEVEDIEDYKVIYKPLDNLMVKIQDAFYNKAGIKIYPLWSKDHESFYFEMGNDDVVVLSPKAEKLKQEGIKFGFQQWVDEW
jgi:hypothetical protein